MEVLQEVVGLEEAAVHGHLEAVKGFYKYDTCKLFSVQALTVAASDSHLAVAQ